MKMLFSYSQSSAIDQCCSAKHVDDRYFTNPMGPFCFQRKYRWLLPFRFQKIRQAFNFRIKSWRSTNRTTYSITSWLEQTVKQQTQFAQFLTHIHVVARSHLHTECTIIADALQLSDQSSVFDFSLTNSNL